MPAPAGARRATFDLRQIPNGHTYTHMRTTVELPDSLLRQAKEKALAQGITLKEVVIQALRKDLEAGDPSSLRLVEFPLIQTGMPGTVRITNADIEALEIDDDAGR